MTEESIYMKTDEQGSTWYFIEHLDYYLMNAFTVPSLYELDDYKERLGAVPVDSDYLYGYGFDSEETAIKAIQKFKEFAQKEGTDCYKNGHTLDQEKKEAEHFASCEACQKIIGWWCREDAPHGICEYNEENDPCHDNCLHCHEPEERK